MPNNLKLSDAATDAAIDAAADAVCALLNGGKLRIYDGAQPATPDTPITTQQLLAELTFGSPAFGAAVAGVATANAITKDSAADATGTAGWFRALTSGNAPVYDGEVGTSGADLNLDTVAIQQNAEVSITSLTYTQPAS